MNGPRPVSALVPAHNEELQVGETVRALLGMPEVSEVVVVDDGSVDGTAHEARRAGAKVLRLERNVGKGGAIEAGLTLTRGDVLLLVDADLGREAAKTGGLLAPLLAREADLAVAIIPSPPRAPGFGLVKAIAHWGVRLLGRRVLVAPLSGQRAVSRRALEALLPLAPGFGVEVAMSLGALRRGFTIREIPTDIRHRPSGRDLGGMLHRLRQLRDVLVVLLTGWWR